MSTGGAIDLYRALEVARAAARDAGALLREGHRQELAIEKKGEVDLVTELDRRSEKLIVDRLRREFPSHGVVGEEGGEQRTDQAGALWLIDPLDGTTNFAHGLPFYAISICLEVAGEAAVAVVTAPELGWELTAARGQGALWNGAPARVSSVPKLDDALVATGFPYDRRSSTDNNTREVAAVIRHVQGLRRFGVASLDCCLVATGRLDAYWEFKLKPWDIAGGALLVREAGGRVSDLEGGGFDPHLGSIVASNGHVHDELLAILRPLRRGQP